MFTLRFRIDSTRIRQLAVDNAVAKSTAYEYLWEGLEVLAAAAPSLHEAIDAAKTGVEAEIALLDIGLPDEEHLLVLIDLGHEKFRAFPAVVVPHKTTKGGKLTEDQRARNRLIGAKRALAEKANADLKVRFKCLDKIGLNPWQSARSPAPAWRSSTSNDPAASPSLRAPRELLPAQFKGIGSPTTDRGAWATGARPSAGP